MSPPSQRPLETLDAQFDCAARLLPLADTNRAVGQAADYTEAAA